mmetsp:Transcript_20087/g.28278  ORF Transcript_20087/g.28278 Transcript_20087/m.28278 type:complete len:634 (+) Transcript_20087:207-2108(+)|eukprot:CAMPEP_0184865876 /NCGR_PEP_ID=MMETSP0580-20130426/19507_1 /TAXON_ID=1118495 /ORGANISM="Dactyliosolen fragilissimus" /LENGTH=633 /DNA_ID=CAMNT_0027365253 /DNA_START=197 /DNA_END=2098 /DNA_ORIENTATION=-
MSQRDPFPMQSEEARRMASSSTDGTSADWNKMGTDTANSGPRLSSGSGDDSGDILVVNKTKASSNDDIYADIDAEDESNRHEGDDEFLDSPIGSRSIFPKPIRKVFGGLYTRLYGDLPVEEMIRTMILSSTLFFMIGGYWLLRSLKDPVITHLCGVTAIPKAKMLSVFVVLGVVSVYNHLLDNPNLKKHTLFYVFGTFYFFLFTVISLLLMHPTIGIPNQVPNYNRTLGWISYCSIESFGSVMVSLFWSFANSNSNFENAKASYGVLVATAQIGSIIGPTFVQQFAESWGVPSVYFIGALCMLFLQSTMYLYVHLYGTDETNEDASKIKPTKKKKGAGVLEGVQLFVQYNYVKGIFAISCLFMVEVTIVDYTMKVLARDHFANLHPCIAGQTCWDLTTNSPSGMSSKATAAFTTFMGLFGQATNTLSFILSFFGTSAVIRTLGLRITLLLFPSLCLAVIIMVRFQPTLYVVFAAMMILKANSYALNNPTKEMLYQPTSSAVKYKAKSWIDIFGARGSKAMGSLVTNAFSDSAANLVSNGSLVGMAVASFLIWNARFMGKSFDEYMETGHIVGEEEDFESVDDVKTGVQMASKQNDDKDTSCAIHDDDEIGDEEEGQSAEELGDKDELPKVRKV